MARDLDPVLVSGLKSGVMQPVVLVEITFRSQTCYLWSGEGPFAWNGNTFIGAGSLGKVGVITEGTEIRSDGMTIGLSGIDPSYQAECMTDIQVGAPAKVWFGNMFNGFLAGRPYLVFSGTVDKPTFDISADSLDITLALENKMLNHARPSMRRYTTADQHTQHPTDTAFNFMPSLSDQALRWGY